MERAGSLKRVLQCLTYFIIQQKWAKGKQSLYLMQKRKKIYCANAERNKSENFSTKFNFYDIISAQK
jgi:hypothetical protein